MGKLITTWGKTWHTWPDPRTPLPMGDPLLMWAFTQDGQIEPELIAARDAKLKISTPEIRRRRGPGGAPRQDEPGGGALNGHGCPPAPPSSAEQRRPVEPLEARPERAFQDRADDGRVADGEPVLAEGERALGHGGDEAVDDLGMRPSAVELAEDQAVEFADGGLTVAERGDARAVLGHQPGDRQRLGAVGGVPRQDGGSKVWSSSEFAMYAWRSAGPAGRGPCRPRRPSGRGDAGPSTRARRTRADRG